jgi:hypothetical protein
MTTSHHEPYPFVTNLIGLFSDWLKKRREFDRADGLRRRIQRLEPVGRELNVTPLVLKRLLLQRSQSANELPYTLTALGIDETALWRAEPAFLLDMERVCSACTHTRQCQRELAAGTAATNYVEYCENADSIDTLRLKS